VQGRNSCRGIAASSALQGPRILACIGGGILDLVGPPAALLGATLPRCRRPPPARHRRTSRGPALLLSPSERLLEAGSARPCDTCGALLADDAGSRQSNASTRWLSSQLGAAVTSSVRTAGTAVACIVATEVRPRARAGAGGPPTCSVPQPRCCMGAAGSQCCADGAGSLRPQLSPEMRAQLDGCE
jgi:hypothetical protein